MNTQPKEIQEYINAEGRAPYQEWVNSLKDVKIRARIRQRVDRLELGNMGTVNLLEMEFMNFVLISGRVIGFILDK